MIGGLILLIGFGYFVLSKYIIKNTYEKYGTKKAKYIATAIMVLIPTWDIVLGYPIYAYLCLTKAGVHIYKTVDNVDGFYVGELDANYPYSPYKGYRYMDYKGEKSDKYYRNYWIDNNTSDLCILPGKQRYGSYAEAFKQGKCIAKEEIAESEVSQWKLEGYKIGSETRIPIFNIHRVVSFQLIDRKTNAVAGELIEYSWGGGWVRDSLRYFTKIAGFGCSGVGKLQDEDLYTKILKPRKGEN